MRGIILGLIILIGLAGSVQGLSVPVPVPPAKVQPFTVSMGSGPQAFNFSLTKPTRVLNETGTVHVILYAGSVVVLEGQYSYSMVNNMTSVIVTVTTSTVTSYSVTDENTR